MVDESYGPNKGQKKINGDVLSRHMPNTANETKTSGEFHFLTTGFGGYCEGKSFNSGSDGTFSPQNKLFNSRPVEKRDLLSVEENDTLTFHNKGINSEFNDE